MSDGILIVFESPQDKKEVLELLVKKVIDVSDLISYTFPLDSIKDAFHFKENGHGMHVSICLQNG